MTNDLRDKWHICYTELDLFELSLKQRIPELNMINYRSDQWYKSRIGKFTASNFGTLMSKASDGGTSWSKSAVTCIEECATELFLNGYLERPDNIFTSWGIDQEKAALTKFEEVSNLKVKQVGFLIHPEIPEVGATPDGLIAVDTPITVQIKCPFNPEIHKEYVRKITCTDTLRKSKSKYFWQMQGEFWVVGGKMGYFVSFDPRMDERYQIHITKIERDDKAIEELGKTVFRVIETRDLFLENYRRSKSTMR